MKTFIITISIILGIIFVILGLVYATHTAANLPAFLPGHGLTDGVIDRVHTKHAIGCFILALAFFILAWFQSGDTNRAS